ncbi:MAG: rod shape-determining protein MreC [Bacillota bacterium]
MKRSRIRKLLAAGILVLFLLVMMQLTGSERAELTVLEAGLRDGSGFVQAGVTFAGNHVRDLFQRFFLFGGNPEVEELRRQVRDLEGEVVALREYRIQNERLQELLDYRNENGRYKMLVADVIGRNPGNWFGEVKVNRGANHGVERGMAVVLPAGLVGRVIAVAPNTADVLLITDPRSGVGAMVQEIRTPGVVKGVLDRTQPLRMFYLSRDAKVERGQYVVTSGLGVVPKGIPVGRIISTRKDEAGLTQTAEVSSLVDFNHLEEVLIILNSVPGG